MIMYHKKWEKEKGQRIILTATVSQSQSKQKGGNKKDFKKKRKTDFFSKVENVCVLLHR